MLQTTVKAQNDKIRVLVVDDSALVRQLLSEILQQDPGIEVVGTATDPYVARDKIKKLNPDVLTLDVEMPRMDGLTFLRNLMRLRPMPVVMISTWTRKGSETTLDALALGAVDFVAKPGADLAQSLGNYAEEIIAKVKIASKARVGIPRLEKRHTNRVAAVPNVDKRVKNNNQVIAIGASTGGTEAIRALLQTMPVESPAIVITQHIPENFSASFAKRLNEHSLISVCEAKDGDVILPGHAYVAPGNRHLLVVKRGAELICRLSDSPPVNRHRPSVDVMFHSVAEMVGPKAVGVIMTGMGADGASGLQDMKAEGAATFAQDEKSSVVWGMPGEAVARGCVDEVVPLPDIAARICKLFIAR